MLSFLLCFFQRLLRHVCRSYRCRCWQSAATVMFAMPLSDGLYAYLPLRRCSAVAIRRAGLPSPAAAAAAVVGRQPPQRAVTVLRNAVFDFLFYSSAFFFFA